MTEPLKIDVLLETREAEREAARAKDALGVLEGAVGRVDARTKEFRRTLEGGTSQVSALGRQLRETFGSITQQDLAAIRGNVGAAFEVIRGGAESMARSAGEAERLGRAQRTLGVDYDRAARGAGGVVDQLAVLNATQALTARGVSLTQAQVDAFARTAQDYARNSGREFNQVAEQLAEVVAKGGEEAARFGPALGALAAPTATANERLEALVRTTRESAPAAQTSAEAYRDLGQAVTEAQRSFSEGFAEGLAEMRRMHGETTDARDVMRELKDDVYALGATAATVFGTLADTIRLVATEVSNTVAGIGDAFNTLTQIRQHPLQAGELLRAYQGRLDARDAEGEAGLRRIIADVMGGERTSLDAGGGPAQGAPGRTRALEIDSGTGAVGEDSAASTAFQESLRRGGGGAANTNATEGPITVGSSALDAIFERELARAMSRGAEEFGRLASAGLQTTFQDDIRGATGVSREAAVTAAPPADAIDARNAQTNRRVAGGTLGDRLDAQNAAREQRELDQRIDSMQSFTDRWRDLHGQQADATRMAAESGTSAFQHFGKALGAHFQLVVEGRETVGVALQGMLSDTLIAIGQEAVVKGAMEIAEGIAALAGIYTAGLAPGHFAAGAAFLGVGALAGVAGAALAPSAGASSGAGAASPSAPVGAMAAANDDGKGGPTNITINLGGGVVMGTSRELGEALGRVINDPNGGVSINASRVRAA